MSSFIQTKSRKILSMKTVELDKKWQGVRDGKYAVWIHYNEECCILEHFHSKEARLERIKTLTKEQ